MTLSEILEWDREYNQDDVSQEQMEYYYNYLVADNFKPVIRNNTLFLVKVEDKVVHYHTMNAAPKKVFVENLKGFFSAVKSEGYKAAYTNLENTKLIPFVRKYFGDSTSVVDDKAITFLN